MRQEKTIVIRLETYEKLDRYKARLMGKKEDSRLTFDDAISDLLSKVEVR